VSKPFMKRIMLPPGYSSSSLLTACKARQQQQQHQVLQMLVTQLRCILTIKTLIPFIVFSGSNAASTPSTTTIQQCTSGLGHANHHWFKLDVPQCRAVVPVECSYYSVADKRCGCQFEDKLG
jgi:hypothetical protein